MSMYRTGSPTTPPRPTTQPASPIKAVATGVGTALFVGIGLTVLFGSWYTVDQTQRAVLLRNGAIVEVVQPGLHWKAPWIESVTKIDMTTQNVHWDKVNSYSADQQPADLRISVTFHVAPDKVGDLYARFSGDISAAVTRLISPHVNQQVKVVFGQYTAARAITNRGQLNADTIKALNESISYDPIFVIEGVQIENIDFSPEYIRSVEQRMQAEVEVQKLQQNLAREKVQAEIAVTQANGRANSVRTEAQARADAIKMTGDAEASAIAARGKALQDNPNVIALTQAERWTGVLPTTMVPGAAVPFINIK